MLIQRSILESNAVRVRQSDEEDTPATVMVFTGGLGDGSQAPTEGDALAYHAPVWRIDDGPVFGVPFELCEAARQGDRKVVEASSASGAPINAADYDRRTCLHLASSEGILPIVAYLLEMNAESAPAARARARGVCVSARALNGPCVLPRSRGAWRSQR